MRFELTPDERGGTTLELGHARIEAPLGMAYISRWSVAIDRLEIA